MSEEAKKCPQCGLMNPKTAILCDCGYNFDSEHYKDLKVKTIVIEVRPWTRFFARSFDYLLFSIVVGFLVGLFAPYEFEINDFLFGYLIVFIWIFFEAIFVSKLGATPGKWIFRTKVLDSSGRKLPFSRALWRSFTVWWRGLGCGIPIVQLATIGIEHGKLTTGGFTTWDKIGGFTVSHEKLSLKRILVILLIFLGFVLLFYLPEYYEDLGLTGIPFANYSSNINIKDLQRYKIGFSNLSIEAPGKLNADIWELSEEEKNMISHHESYFFSSDGFEIAANFIEYEDWLSPDPSGVEEAVFESINKTEGVKDFISQSEPITISNISGRLSKGSYKEHNIHWGFKQAVLVKNNKRWQVLVFYAVDFIDEEVSERIIESIIIEGN